MHFVYVLQSSKDKKFYVGYSKELKQRVEKHNRGLVTATKQRQPLRLVYYEACLSKNDALKREKYLKTGWGKRFIKNRLKDYLTGWKADGAESKKDFRHKIALCKKESKETKHWLRMIARANPDEKTECKKLWSEAHELTLIFSSIIAPKKW